MTSEPTWSLTPVGVKALAGNNGGSALCTSLLDVWVVGYRHREDEQGNTELLPGQQAPHTKNHTK